MLITVGELRSTLCMKTPLYVQSGPYIKQIQLDHLSYIKKMPLKHLLYIKETSWNTLCRIYSRTEFTRGVNGAIENLIRPCPTSGPKMNLCMCTDCQLYMETVHSVRQIILSGSGDMGIQNATLIYYVVTSNVCLHQNWTLSCSLTAVAGEITHQWTLHGTWLWGLCNGQNSKGWCLKWPRYMC